MKLNNAFTTETRDLFYEVRYLCWICGENGSCSGGMELHHITGRDSRSPFNGSPVCKLCHSKMGHTKDEERHLFEKTAVYLKRIGYKITDEDEAFMIAHPHLLTNISDIL